MVINNAELERNPDKHIAIKETTKERLARFSPKTMYWDDFVNAVCDFLEDREAEFKEFIQKQ